MESEGKSCGTGPDGKRCGCLCHKFPGLLIALIGLVVLLANIGVITWGLAGIIWPVLLILFGLKKACGKGMCKCCTRG